MLPLAEAIPKAATRLKRGTPSVVAQEVIDESLAAAESAGLPDASGDAAQTLIFSGASFTTMTEAEELFKFMIEDLSGGSIKIDWHPYNELGDDLNVISNVQFGEGGAGTFSDGKLTTGTHDPRISAVMDTLVAAGAPEDVKWSHRPHVGTDILRQVVKTIRQELISLGCEVRFEHQLTGLIREGDRLTGVQVRSPQEDYTLPCDAWCWPPATPPGTPSCWPRWCWRA